MWITESWIAPRLEALRASLDDPITEEQAQVLTACLQKECRLDDVLEWLEHKPTSWAEFLELKARRATKDDLAVMEKGFFPWEDVRASEGDQYTGPDVAEHRAAAAARSHACPKCGTPPEQLKWIYFRSPDWTWEQMCGREGWLSLCEDCGLQVDFRLGVMS